MSLLEDKDAIRDVLSQYCFHTDTGDHAGRAALFTADASFETPLGTYKGRDEIEKFVASIFPPAGRPARKHCVTNSLIKVHGDHAEAESYLIIIRENPGAPSIAFGGRYVDRLVRRDGTWLISRRQIISDLDPEETGRSVFS